MADIIKLKKKTLSDLTKEELIKELEARDKAIKYLSKELENFSQKKEFKDKQILKDVKK